MSSVRRTALTVRATLATTAPAAAQFQIALDQVASGLECAQGDRH